MTPMVKIMRFPLFSLAFLLMSNRVSAACFTPAVAEMLGCVSRANGNTACQSRHGQQFRSYFTTDICSLEQAARMRGERPPRISNTPVRASCMTYEEGSRRGCHPYNYHRATLYCHQNYGPRFIAFMPRGRRCTLAAARSARNEHAPSALINGLEDKMRLIQGLVQKINQETLGAMQLTSIAKIQSHPLFFESIPAHFRSTSVLTLLQSMQEAKELIWEKANLNIPLGESSEHKQFLRYLFDYMDVQMKLAQLYAYIAHKNHLMLATYDFHDLDFLNLKLPIRYALEVLSLSQQKAKHVDNWQAVEFELSALLKQELEFNAVKVLHSQADYMKLFTFMGIQRNLVNDWAARSYSIRSLRESSVHKCGNNLLSFRPAANGKMSESELAMELKRDELFYTDYRQRLSGINQAVLAAPLFTSQQIHDLLMHVIWQERNLRRRYIYLNRRAGNDLNRSSFSSLMTTLSENIVSFESQWWQHNSEMIIAGLILPADRVESKWDIIQGIKTQVLRIKQEAFRDIILGSLIGFSQQQVELIQRRIAQYVQDHILMEWSSSLESSLAMALENYAYHRHMASRKRTRLQRETALVANRALFAAKVQDKLSENEGELADEERFEIEDVMTLRSFFEQKIDKEYFDLRYSLLFDQRKKAIVDKFFVNLRNRVNRDDWVQQLNYASSQVRSTNAKLRLADKLRREDPQRRRLANIIRREAINLARELFERYPYRRSLDMHSRSFPRPNETSWEGSDETVSHHSMQNYEQITDAREVMLEDHREFLQAFSMNAGLNGIEEDISRSYQIMFREIFVSDHGLNNLGNVHTGEREYNRNYQSQSLTNSQGRLSLTTRDENNIEAYLFAYRHSLMDLAGRRRPRSEARNIPRFRHRETNHILRLLSTTAFVERFLESLNLRFVAYDNWEENTGSFTPQISDQKLATRQVIQQAYMAAPILRQFVTITNHNSSSRPALGQRVGVTLSRVAQRRVSLLTQLALEESTAGGHLNINSAIAKVQRVYQRTLRNVPRKLQLFCRVDYFNFENDQRTRNLYNASSVLTTDILSYARMGRQLNHMAILKRNVERRLRSTSDVIMQDYIRPIEVPLAVIGIAASASSFGISWLVGRQLAAKTIPFFLRFLGSSEVLALGGSLERLAMAELWLSAPLLLTDIVTRSHLHYIDIPQRLKFQYSLANSQLMPERVTSWESWEGLNRRQRFNILTDVGMIAPFTFMHFSALFH